MHGVIWSHHVWHTSLSECPSPPLPPKVVLHCHVPGLPVHCDCGPAELADCPDEWTYNNFRKMWKAPLSLQEQESLPGCRRENDCSSCMGKVRSRYSSLYCIHLAQLHRINGTDLLYIIFTPISSMHHKHSMVALYRIMHTVW